MNRLGGETSPYLLQHADNPVDWLPWGEDAFAEARGRFAELPEAQQGPELDGVLTAWWGRAMLDTDPHRDRVRAAAEAGTLPIATMDDIARRRQERITS